MPSLAWRTRTRALCRKTKTPKEKKTIETRERAEVKDFKAAISEAFSAPQEQLCLIYAGKILKVHPYMFGDKALKNY